MSRGVYGISSNTFTTLYLPSWWWWFVPGSWWECKLLYCAINYLNKNCPSRWFHNCVGLIYSIKIVQFYIDYREILGRIISRNQWLWFRRDLGRDSKKEEREEPKVTNGVIFLNETSIHLDVRNRPLPGLYLQQVTKMILKQYTSLVFSLRSQ